MSHRVVPTIICEYEGLNHEIDPVYANLVYWDPPRGMKEINICRFHYAKHILAHYPTSRMADYIRKNPGEFEKGFPGAKLDVQHEPEQQEAG